MNEQIFCTAFGDPGVHIPGPMQAVMNLAAQAKYTHAGTGPGTTLSSFEPYLAF